MKHIYHLFFFLFIGVAPLYAQQIQLPVEVLGAEGKVVTRTFDLSAQEASNAARLWLQVNNLSYQNKASIKINNGAWLTLNHQTVIMQAQEKARGGMVHGGFNTVRISIPATGIIAGSNTISFRFDLSDAISNGYRVVKFNLLDAKSSKILPESRFKQDDPKTWVAPYTDAASIEQGRNLWYNGSLKSNYLPAGRKGFWYSAQLNPSGIINAKCSSCHTQDGRDLEIFSYSNESIIERSKFHMLSEDEGKKIASYIRSLSSTKPNVGRWGRPWNPPYQPGPAVASMPVQQWAAGAGLDAVLDEDKDMLPYLFPNGVDQQKVYETFDSDKSVDRTLIPLAIQFPDWKHWLPMVHPMDAYNKNNYYLSETTGPNNPNKNYKEVRTYLETNAPLGFPNKAELLDKIHILHNHFRFFVEQGGTIKNHWRTADGDATKNLNDGVPRELAATSLARLFAVKNFEFVNEFNLQDKAAQFNPNDQVQPRQWPGDEYNVFEVPPHFQACVDNNCNQFMGQPTETGMYESTMWYQMQMVINGGDGFVSHNSPVDYNYHPDFVTKACNSSGVNEPLRYYHSMNVMYQTRTWSKGGSPNTGKGFRIRVMGPWNIYGITDGNQFNGFAPGEFAKTLNNVKPGLTAWVMNAMLRQFLTEVNKPENSLSIWNRTPDGDDNTLDRADKTYADIIDAVQRTERQETFFVHYAAKFYYYIPRFQKLGVDCQIMEEVINWCKKAWPLIDWHVFSNKGEMQLSLTLEDEKFCSGTNKIKAIATNASATTVYNWKVNGVAASATGAELSANTIKPGDVITCQISNNSTCLANKTVQATLVMPSKGYNITMRKVGEPDFKPLSNTVACINDKVELKLNIDIQPKQWLDAMDVNAGAEPANNSRIASWWDKSGHGFNADANKTELQPKYVIDAMNGLPAIVFGADNNADGLELFNTAEDDFMNNDWTIMFVGNSEKPAGNDDWRDVIGNKTEGANGWFWRFGSNARVQVGIGPDLQHGKEYNFNRSYIVQITKKGDVITTYLNGRSDRVITKGANVTMTINDALYLGQSAGGNGGSSRYHKGPISELLVFETAISDAQKEFLEGYLTNKWKLNNELVFTHPYYKNSPFDLSLNTPNGAKYKFDAISTSNTINIDQVNKFGTYNFIKEVCGALVESISITNGCNITQSPYLGTPWPIPGKIEAENYDDGGEGIAYHDNDIANNGGQQRINQGVDVENTGDTQGGVHNVGFTNPGEWMEYSVNVTTTGIYTLEARVASPGAGNSMRVELDGVAIGTIAIPNTTGWQTYQTVPVTTPTLAAGQHVLRIFELTGGFNINYINFVRTAQAPVIASAGTASGITGTAFIYQITASNTPTSYGATGLPTGLSLNTSTGAITGSPTTTGTYTTTVGATNTAGTGTKTVVITINSPAPSVTSAATVTGKVASAFSYQITATNNPTSYSATGLPAGLSVNTTTGLISGTPAVQGTSNATINATNATGTGNKTVTITINPQAPVITSAATASSVVSTAFNYQITASNNPTSYNATGLPAGLSVNTTTGVISGTPTIAGTYNATISAANVTGPGSMTVTITITNQPSSTPYRGTPWPIPGTIQAENYDDGGEGIAYHDNDAINSGGQQRTTQGVDVENTGDTQGGQYNVGWTGAGEWLKYTVNVATTGTYTLNVRVASPATGKSIRFEIDGNSIATLAIPNTTGWQTYQTIPVQTSTITAGSHSLRIFMETDGFNLNYIAFALNAIPAVTSAATATGTVGSSFSYQTTASNNPISFNASGLPAGLTINTTTGLISGTPASQGTSNVTISATNASGTGNKTVTITINPASPSITNASTATGTVGSPLSFQITASNNPTSFNATGLPAGLTVNTTTGLISGTPTAQGSSNVTISATNASGTGNKTVTITINQAAPVVSSVATTTGTVGSSFSYQIAASNNPTNFNATGLPAGLSVNTTTGLISGTPTTAGNSTATISASNASGQGSKTVTITINPAAGSTPYLGTRWAIPGTIQAENYDDGGEGIAYHDNDAVNNGGQQRTTQGVDVENTGDTQGGQYNVGFTGNGEWLKYSVNVIATGTYTLQVRVASPYTGKSLRVEMDGNIIATISIPNTTGWQTYQTVEVPSGNLTAGNHTMRIFMESDGFNLNYVAFVSPADPAGVVTCYKAPAAITVNGNLSEAGWNLNKSITKPVFGTPNNMATFGVLWDNTNLYIGVKVLDANLFSDSPDWWEDDAVEIYIDANYNKLASYDGFDNQIIKGFNKPGISTKLNITGLQHAWIAITGGYAVEIAIPWSQLGISAPAAGLNLGFDISYNDDDNGAGRDGQAVWNGSVNNWSNTTEFGKLTLNAGVSARIATGVENVISENTMVLYPNPVINGNVTAELPSEWSGAAQVYIMNAIGALVQTEAKIIDNNQLQINVAELGSGIYFMQIINVNGIVTKRFVVQ